MRRKDRLCLLIPLIIMVAEPFYSQQIKEKIVVTNVEVVVRVLQHGQPLGGLNKSDFQLFENGKEKEINGFFEKRRRIGLLQEELEVSPPQQKQRLFLFYFWTREKLQKIHRQAVDCFFETIFRPGDEVILMADEQPFSISDPSQARKSCNNFFSFINRRRAFATSYNQSQLMRSGSAEAWNTFQEQDRRIQENLNVMAEGVFMDRQANILTGVARKLRMVEKEKWAFVFMVAEPNVRSFSMMIPKQDRSLLDEVNEEFIQSQTTFNLFTFHSSLFNVVAGEDWPPFVRPMASDMVRDIFSIVSQSTGGQVLSGSRYQQSFEKVAQREDVYYVLTYAPETVQAKRAAELEIRTGLKNVKVLYKQQAEIRMAGKLSIEHFSFFKDEMTFTVSGYEHPLSRGGPQSHLRISVQAEPDSGNPLTYEREIRSPEEKLEVSVKLAFPAAGPYKLRLTVSDILSGQTDTETLDVTVE